MKGFPGMEVPFIAMCLWRTRAGLIREKPPGTSYVVRSRVTCTSVCVCWAGLRFGGNRCYEVCCSVLVLLVVSDYCCVYAVTAASVTTTSNITVHTHVTCFVVATGSLGFLMCS